MIEDKEIGLKLAENKEEAIWKTIKDKANQSILNNSIDTEINQLILKYIEDNHKVNEADSS